MIPNANLHQIRLRYATLRSEKQNAALLEGLRRAGLPVWPYGFTGTDRLQLTGPALAAVAIDVEWTGHLGNGIPFQLQSDAMGKFTYRSDAGDVTGRQFLRDDQLCQIATDRPMTPELCGPVYRSPPGQDAELPFAFVAADEIRYFSTRE